MFGFNDINLKETRFYQQAFDEGAAAGRDVGRQEGILEGRQEGRAEGEATLLLRQLTRRFGPLPESVREADADTLLAWGERLLDARTVEDLWEH